MDIAAYFDYYIYSNLIKSLFLRKKGMVKRFAENNGAVLVWGPSVFIGGEFSGVNGAEVYALLAEKEGQKFIYTPDEKWRGFIENSFAGKLHDRQLNVYVAKETDGIAEDRENIFAVTREFMEKNLPNTDMIADELYSYTDMEDFYRCGFGAALVIDGAVCGYCLSEYSVDGSHGLNIWVDEKYRGRGYAKAMTKRALALCGEKNEAACWVCDADNIVSNRTAVSGGFNLEATMHYFDMEG